MEVICINGKFSQEQIDFWVLHGVRWPEESKIYHICDWVKHSTGEVSVYLSELDDNPLVPIIHPILGVQMMCVGFAPKRFTTLLGGTVEMEQIKNLIDL